MQGKITFHMKTNNGFSLVNVLCLGKIMEIREGKKQVTEKRTRAFIAVLVSSIWLFEIMLRGFI